MNEDKGQILAARVPEGLIKKLDRAAKKADRTRSAEVRVRLEASLAADAVRQEGPRTHVPSRRSAAPGAD